MDGYYTLAQANHAIAHNIRLVGAYTARLKLSLLLHQRVILADHMIVNAPNLPKALDRYPDIEDLFVPNLIRIAYFETNKDRERTPMSLGQLFDFYRRYKLTHPKLDLARYTRTKKIPFFESLANSAGRVVPDAKFRDPNFTAACDSLIESDNFREFLGNADYTAFKTAYVFLREDVPILGIIHFDPKHRIREEKTIFEYIKDRIPSFDGCPLFEIEEHFKKIVPLFRTLLISVENALLSSNAILPSELAPHQDVLLGANSQNTMLHRKQEKAMLDLDLGAIDVDTLANMPIDTLRRLRESDEGQAYLWLPPDTGIVETRNLFCRYLTRINIDLSRNHRNRTRWSRVVVSRCVSVGKKLAEPVYTSTVKVLGSHHPLVVLVDPIVRHVAHAVSRNPVSIGNGIDGNVVMLPENTARLTQFRS